MIPAPTPQPPTKTPLTTRLKRYSKALIAAAGTAVTLAALAFPDSKYVIAAVAVATAFGVYRVPNAKTPKAT